jgi:hypothetical protein
VRCYALYVVPFGHTDSSAAAVRPTVRVDGAGQPLQLVRATG